MNEYGNVSEEEILNLKNTHQVIDYHHIDDYRCERPLDEALGEQPGTPRERVELERMLRGELHRIFREAGWEGDGVIDCIFIPPCFTDLLVDCQVVYHVKQLNNGTSWLAIPKDLKLEMPEGSLSERPPYVKVMPLNEVSDTKKQKPLSLEAVVKMTAGMVDVLKGKQMTIGLTVELFACLGRSITALADALSRKLDKHR